jgi:hypothetical protein
LKKFKMVAIFRLAAYAACAAAYVPANTFRASYRAPLNTKESEFEALKEALVTALADKASLATGLNYCPDAGGNGAVSVYARVEKCGFDFDSSTVGLVNKDGDSIFPVFRNFPHSTSQLSLSAYENLRDCQVVEASPPYESCADPFGTPANFDSNGMRPSDSPKKKKKTKKNVETDSDSTDEGTQTMEMVLVVLVCCLLVAFFYYRQQQDNANAAPATVAKTPATSTSATEPDHAAAL